MVGPPAIFLTGDPFEVFVGIVSDVTIFVVRFERDSVFTNGSRSLESKEDDDMAIPCAIITHLRVVVSSFAVMAMHAGGPHTERKTVKDFAKSIPGEREEMAFAIRKENRFDSPFVRDNALGQGELFAFVRTCMDDARVIKIAGKPHDFDFGFCRFHKHRQSEGC